MNRLVHLRTLLARCLFAFLLAFVPRAGADGANRPNVVLILADDLGYETIGANGGTSYRTPVLDRLAQAGARFTQLTP